MLEILLALARSKASKPLSTDGGDIPASGRDCTPAISIVRSMTTGSVRVIIKEFLEGVGGVWHDIAAPCRDR
jgi:hypothetical protein